MPSSTSLNSTSDLPWASSRRSRSFSGKFQATTSFTSGNSVPQFWSNSTLKPPGAGSLLRTTVQILSRSALENSQEPITALAESPSVGGSCADAAETVTSIAKRTARVMPVILGDRSSIRQLGKILPFRRIRRFRNRRERRLARHPGQNIVDHELIHGRARHLGGGAEMREQHDVLHLHQFLRDLRLLGEDVEPGRIDG